MTRFWSRTPMGDKQGKTPMKYMGIRKTAVCYTFTNLLESAFVFLAQYSIIIFLSFSFKGRWKGSRESWRLLWNATAESLGLFNVCQPWCDHNQFVSPQIQNTVNGVQSVGLIGIGDICVDNHTFRYFSLICWNIFMDNLRNE